MSEVLSSPFNKPECGDMHQNAGTITQAHLRDVLGGEIDLQIVGTDPGLVGPVTAPMSEDYEPTIGTLNPDGTFLITIETDAAVYVVVLADGTQFTITAVQSTAYLGQWYPARLLKVLADGTTGSFSVGY
jgi:hypothetical protein